MVTTRTGHKHDKLVRFKTGVSVRKFLNFNSPSNWDLLPEDYCYSDNPITTCDNDGQSSLYTSDHANSTGNGHVNGRAFTPQECIYQDDSLTVADNYNQTIEYDENVNLWSCLTVIWDTIIFIAFTLICYTIATFSYEHFGYSVYLVGSSLGFICFHYTIIYYDSAKPGVLPPSPVSPSKIRQASGHTFHLTYVMSVLCGVVFLLCNLWLPSTSPIPVV